MAYDVNQPPQLINQALVGVRMWYHESADNTAATDTSGFITNGGSLGMKPGDIVYHKDSTSNATALTMHKVVTVSATYPGAVDLSDGVVVGSATNTD